VQAILQSPSFLYRIEVGAEPSDTEGVVALDDWEVASRLSYLLWNSMPDDALFAAAAALIALVGAAQAQDWPNRPVTLVVPFAPGEVEHHCRIKGPALFERGHGHRIDPVRHDHRDGAIGAEQRIKRLLDQH